MSSDNLKPKVLPQMEDGEWVKPVMKGWEMECCDCGLRHKVDFEYRVKGKKVRGVLRMRARRIAAAKVSCLSGVGERIRKMALKLKKICGLC